MNRRQLIACGLLAATGCSASPDLPSLVAADAALISSGLAGAFKNASGIPGSVATALSDLAVAAQALASAETTVSARPLVLRVVTDVDAVVVAVAGLPLPPQVEIALAAAQILLPAIEAAVGLTITKVAAGGMTPEQARAALAELAR